MSSADDKEIIQQARNGDRQAFNRLVNKYKKQIYYVAMKMVKNKDDAYDITQDVFIRAYKSLDSFRGDASFGTWLYRIAINTSINYVNRDKYRDMQSVADMDYLLESKERPDRDYVENELSNRLEKAVSALPDRQRAIFILRYYQQLPHSEIAKILNRSEGAVKSGYFNALQKLKKEFKDILTIGSNKPLANQELL